MKYRADLDGIRALAIIPVLLFHAEFSLLPQGYLGVDVFFVLSGFLIGAYLVDEVKLNGRIDFTSFYERRIRRIFPALLFMMLVISIIALSILTPRDLLEYAKSQVSALFSVSNIYFWRQSSYFDTANNLKPLLHTWSLSVEEQFYLFFPWLLFFIRGKSDPFKIKVMSVLILLSLLAAQALSMIKPVASFYLLPTRAYELLLGVWATMLLRDTAFTSRLQQMPSLHAHVISLTLIAAILLMMAVPLEKVPLPSPGLYSFSISLFVALLCIIGLKDGIGSRMLSWQPLVFIGLLSYSLYLWHQPIFALARYLSPFAISDLSYLGLIGISAVAAYLSWRFVETPFRNRSRFSRRQIWILAGLTSTLVLLLSLGLVFVKGLPQRFPASTLELMEMSVQGRAHAELCSASRDKPFDIKNMCQLGTDAKDTLASYMLIGDSHAAAITPGVSVMLKQAGLKAYQATYLGCPPGINIERIDNNFRCASFNQQVIDFISQHPEVKNIIVSARWALMTNQSGYDNGEGGVEPPETPRYKTQADVTAMQSSVQLINWLLEQGRRVILIYPIPEVGVNVPMAVYRLNRDISTDYARFTTRTSEIYQTFDSMHDAHLFKVYPARRLCDLTSNRCIATLDKSPLYYDDDHLSQQGAELALQDLNQVFAEIANMSD